jgi:cold shock CspA family protein
MVDSRESRRSGKVTAFDFDRGLGEIASDGEVFAFHCVSIADGSRSIDLDVAVSFTVLHKLGRHEADDIRPM